MTVCDDQEPMIMTNDDIDAALTRKCTEDQPVLSLLFSATPQKDYENKRRRLTSENSGALNPRATNNGDLCSQGETAIPTFAKNIEESLRLQLNEWARTLVKLQPKVYMSEHLLQCGMCLFKYLRHLQVAASLEGRFPVEYLANDNLMLHDLAACWWMALKHCSIRTAVPNRTLISRATGTEPQLLADRELAALIGMGWRVNHVLRLHGLAK